MARKAFQEKRKFIAESLARMVLGYLRNRIFPSLTDQEFKNRTGISASALGVPWWQDIPEICECAGLDLGIVIRDSKGSEVTFWPPENFATGPSIPKVSPKGIAVASPIRGSEGASGDGI